MSQAKARLSTTGSVLPPASYVLSNLPILSRILHAHRCGGLRGHTNAALLKAGLASGTVQIDDVIMPWRPVVTPEVIEYLLYNVGDRRRGESAGHRLLKVHALLLARIVDPASVLQAEAPVTHDRFPLRADLLSVGADGARRSYEAGACDGRSVFSQLHSHVETVVVLPYAGLGIGSLCGYSFRKSATPPLPQVQHDDAERTWAALIDRSLAA